MENLGLKFKAGDATAVLIWTDSIIPPNPEYIKKLTPWKIINRIPKINVLCKKVPLSILLNIAKSHFPELYSFYPQTFILPRDEKQFMTVLKSTTSDFLIKPDAGSFGNGIRIVNSKSKVYPTTTSSVAQEYIKSFLINNTKFDLRIYVLIASITPLRVYIYRDGLCRFCSLKSNLKSRYSRITNVALNRNANGTKIEDTSRLISDVFPELSSNGVDVSSIWSEIDDIVLLTIISSYKYLKQAVDEELPTNSFSRCFQILGFDILLDENLKPHILEVNYRPSLEYYRGVERRMKVEMIQDAIRIAGPYETIQNCILSRKWCWTRSLWNKFITENQQIISEIKERRKYALENSKYVKIWPNKKKKEKYQNVIDKILSLDLDEVVNDVK
ncbi:Tubulin-tyrosine ligase family protein [Histomonas meleagridis]|uniref:Tubulin-tyrosine ligase family protein n=1 Tax=Histomonas meleagridis TaxID=135588 RepID=UPI00355951F7|nr:Tubulin-tyrosine ligase family protein [Histomonas meleagridis]KAH0807075.1 Tubulin-tyrosine ligase family protein [Histomonas meleagridis]